MNSLSACTTRRLASSVPTLMRKRIRQLVGADLAQDEAALCQECVGVFGRAAFGFRKMDEHEIRRRSASP